MRNIIKTAFAGLVSQARTAATALAAKAEALGLVHVVPVAFTTRINNAVAAREAHDKAKTEWESDRNALKARTKSARAFARLAREVLKPFFGETFNAVLAGAGFDGSFEIPRNRAKLVEMLRKLGSYLAANPTHENLVLEVTAANANALASEIESLIASAAEKKAATRSKKADRDAKTALVRSDLRTLMRELRTVLSPVSAEWDQFGFNPPGILAAPEVPANVIAVLIGQNAVSVKWDRAPRAGHYRIWKRIVGVDEQLIAAGTRADLDFTIESLPANATIEIAVSAVNNGGESVKSEVIVITTT